MREEGSDRARALFELDAPVATSWLSFTETSAAIAAARRARRLTRPAATSALGLLEETWGSFAALSADGGLCRAAAALAARHRLRGAGAVQLASALLLADARPVVVTWDIPLQRAARAEGLAVAVV